MAEEILVKEALTGEMIEAGASVVKGLKKRRFVVDAAVWLYLSELNRWRLVLATPGLRRDGPKKAYKRLLQNLRSMDTHRISLEDVALADSRDPLIQVIRHALRTYRSPNGIRFSREMVQGQFIEDAYVYRLSDQAVSPKSRARVRTSVIAKPKLRVAKVEDGSSNRTRATRD
jgi:hypothetical protein